MSKINFSYLDFFSREGPNNRKSQVQTGRRSVC